MRPLPSGAAAATGGSFANVPTPTVFVWVSLAPRSSVTVSVTSYSPSVAYTWSTTMPEPVAPSPKLHSQTTGCPPGPSSSVEAPPSSVAVRPLVA